MCKLFTPGLIFQSTLLMRGATCCALSRAVCRLYFNPRSSCEERRRSRRLALRFRNFNPRSSCEERPAARKCIGIATRRISIHAPHARSDVFLLAVGHVVDISIHAPHARSDFVAWAGQHPQMISIHAPHARSDCFQPSITVGGEYFNPRSSCEERPEDRIVEAGNRLLFQSTLLMRGATWN